MLKIRRSRDHLIFNMGITIPGKDGLYIETGPRYLNQFFLQPSFGDTFLGNVQNIHHKNVLQNLTIKIPATSPDVPWVKSQTQSLPLSYYLSDDPSILPVHADCPLSATLEAHWKAPHPDWLVHRLMKHRSTAAISVGKTAKIMYAKGRAQNKGAQSYLYTKFFVVMIYQISYVKML